MSIKITKINKHWISDYCEQATNESYLLWLSYDATLLLKYQKLYVSNVQKPVYIM